MLSQTSASGLLALLSAMPSRAYKYDGGGSDTMSEIPQRRGYATHSFTWRSRGTG
jgi:hypothetical protein